MAVFGFPDKKNQKTHLLVEVPKILSLLIHFDPEAEVTGLDAFPADEQPPVKLLWLWTVDTPLTPLPMSKLRRGVEAALPVIRDGYGVLSHCRAGIHRGAAMACCVLIGLGYSASEAIRLVESKRQIADPGIWYIRRRIEKFERVWKHHPVI